MEVLVFKTTVQDPFMVKALKPSLDGLAGEGKWNFDLSDCDRILRIATHTVRPEEAINLLARFDLRCIELED